MMTACSDECYFAFLLREARKTTTAVMTMSTRTSLGLSNKPNTPCLRPALLFLAGHEPPSRRSGAEAH